MSSSPPSVAGADSPDPITNDSANDGVNLWLAVGIPVGIVGGLIIILIIVLLLWKWKYKRKYSMNDSMTPTKTLTHNEARLGSATPPGHPGTKNGSVGSRPEILLRTPSREAELYVVRHLYEAQESNQLTLQTGRIVEVIEKNTNGWWRGMIEDEVGWFPAAYVRKIEASEKVKYRQQSNQNTPEKRSASPVRLVKKNQQAAKKKAPAIPNGTKPPPREQESGNKSGTLETSVRSDTHQLISSGDESLGNMTTEDSSDGVTVEPVRDFESVDNEEKLEGFINEIFTVEDEVKASRRASPTETPETNRHTENPEDPEQRKVVREQVQSQQYSGPDSTVVDVSPSVIASQDKSLSRPVPAKRNQPVLSSAEQVTSERQVESERSSEQHGSPTTVLHSTPKRKSVSEQKTQTYVAMYPFTAVHREQLSLSPNDVIQAKGNVVNGWIKGNKRGDTQEGWFPESYVREALENGHQSEASTTATSGTDGMSSPLSVEKSLSESEFSDPADQSFEDELTGMAYRVIHPYSAQQDGDLDLQDGDLVVVLESLDNGWWRGVQAGKEGWFPGSYVQVIPQTPMVSKDMKNPFSTLPRNFKQGEVEEGSADGGVDTNKRCTLPSGASPAMLQQEEEEEEGTEVVNTPSNKPSVPKRFVIPKLVKAHKNKSQKRRPVKAPPPAPPPVLPGSGGHQPIAPPRRSKRASVSRPSVPPPRPPSELDSSAGSGELELKDKREWETQEKDEEISNMANPYEDISISHDITDEGKGIELEKSLSPSLYGHNGSFSVHTSGYSNEDQSPEVSMREPLEETEVFERMASLSPIHQSAGVRGRVTDNMDTGVEADVSGELERSGNSYGADMSTVAFNNEGTVEFSSFKQKEKSSVSDSTNKETVIRNEPVYAVVQKKKKTKVEDKSIEKGDQARATFSPSPKAALEGSVHKAERSPNTDTSPVNSSQNKIKPVIGPKPATPVARELFEEPQKAVDSVDTEVAIEYPPPKGYGTEMEDIEPRGESEITQDGKSPLRIVQNTENVHIVKRDKSNKTEITDSGKNRDSFNLALDISEPDQDLLAEIMNSFEDLRTSIGSPRESPPLLETDPTTVGHDDSGNYLPEEKRKSPSRVHYDSSISFEQETLPGVGSHKTHQEGDKSTLLPATYAQDPMQMGSKQQSVVYDSNQEVGSSPSKALIIQDKPPLPAKPSISPVKSISGNSDMSSRSDSSFENSNVTSDRSGTSYSANFAEATENSVVSDKSNLSVSDYGTHPDAVSLSDLPDDIHPESDRSIDYTGNTSDEPPPLPEGPPPESPLMDTKLPKPKKSVLSKALKSPDYELIMTSPYVVIKTPDASNKTLLQDIDTEEVSMLTRSTEVTEEPGEEGSGNSESGTRGLRSQISGLLDKFLPDVFNPTTRNSEPTDEEAVISHPVSQIEFMDSFNFRQKNDWANENTRMQHQSGDVEGDSNQGKSCYEGQNSDLSFVDDVSEVSSSNNASPGTKPKSKRPAKPPRKSKSISSDEERIVMKKKEDIPTQETESKNTEESGLRKYQLPALRPPPVSDLTERYRRTSAGSSVPSMGSSPPVSPDTPSPVKLSPTGHFNTSTPQQNGTGQEAEYTEDSSNNNDTGVNSTPLTTELYSAEVKVVHNHTSQDDGSVRNNNYMTNNNRVSDVDSPLRFFTPSKFVSKPFYTPSPQIIQRDASLADSGFSMTESSKNEIHFQVDEIPDSYSVRVLNSINARPPADDYRVTADGGKQGHDSKIIAFDTPKPFQKPGQLKKVTAPKSQYPPQLIQCEEEEDGRVYI